MNSNAIDQGRFLICSKILEIMLAAVMLVALIISLVKQRQKKYEEDDQPSFQPTLQHLDKKKSADN